MLPFVERFAVEGVHLGPENGMVSGLLIDRVQRAGTRNQAPSEHEATEGLKAAILNYSNRAIWN